MTVRRAKTELKAVSKKGAFDGGWYWQLLAEDAHQPRSCSGSDGGASSPKVSTLAKNSESDTPQEAASEASKKRQSDKKDSVKKIIDVVL